MSELDQKLSMIQDQLNSRVLWDSPDFEVLEWLEQKHGIDGDRATTMLSVAKAFRAKSIREKALYGVIFSGIGALGTGGVVALQLFGGVVFVLRTIILTIAFGFCCLWFARYMSRLITGLTDSSAGL